MLILGISAFYHESAVCAFVDGRLVAAVAEERLSRIKHDAALPVEAFRWCLERVGADVTDVDALAYYEQPVAKLARQLWAGARAGDRELAWLDAAAAERAIRQGLGWEGEILSFPHHLSHAASAFYLSGFEEAAVLTADGVGEWATAGYGRGAGDDVELFATVDFPHSLGLFYSTITALLGFRVNSGEYKVMGLAPYGKPRFAERLREVLRDGPGPEFALDLRYVDFVRGERMYSDELVALLGVAPREAGARLDAVHADVAASAQLVLEEVLLAKARWLAAEVGSANLCLAGGVGLNSVANGRLLREGPFERLFVPPAPGDAGGALGAAALAHRQLTGGRPASGAPGSPLVDDRLGPGWSGEAVADLLAASGLEHHDLRGRRAELAEATARRLADGQVVGWFQGGLELGPRALGGRSILADPRDPTMRDRLNRRIKKREGFRPFAPAVLAERALQHFDLGRGGAASATAEDPDGGPPPADDPFRLARFMLQTCRVTSPLALPAVTHVDGSARPQTVDAASHPRFAALLRAFERLTGCPVLLNTSFNVAGEPIVASPADALMTFAISGLDVLVLGDFVIERAALPDGLAEQVAVWRADRRRPWVEGGGRPTGDLYTFV